MYATQAPYRHLAEELMNYERSATYSEVLVPWLGENQREVLWLQEFGRRVGSPIPSASSEELCRLYALGRVCETLLLRFQSGQVDEWPGPHLTLGEYESFAQALGLATSRPISYSPFHHEITALVESNDPDQPVRLTAYDWPCLTLGTMLFSRAGVRVSAGARKLAPGVANSSTIYWAYRRKCRPCHDLSEGWGSNSQWATKFRRDYWIGNKFWFNVDGKVDLSRTPLSPDEYGLSPAERVELLTNRCLVTTNKANNNLWPYDDTICLAANAV